MTAADVAERLDARRTGPDRWRARCPAHEDRTPSLDITAGDDGRTLLLCRAGCPTADVLRAASLSWEDLFLERASSHHHHHRHDVDPQAALHRRAEQGLRRWMEIAGRHLRDDVHGQYRAIDAAERILAEDRDDERGWVLMRMGYLGLPEREWLLDLLDSRRPGDWLRAWRHMEEYT